MMRRKYYVPIFLVVSFIFISGTIDLNNLYNYADQSIPDYIAKDNTGDNPITDAGATLGRVLFYDKKLSSNDQVACASCHHQEFAFGDLATFSQGVNGLTSRNAMRLINNRFSDEAHYFWDERASTLEEQTTMPIRDHIEMGYSGTMGDPDFSDLITELESIDYYNTLFEFVYGDPSVTEERIQMAIAQFLRSIQSFDSKYDQGRSLVEDDSTPFPNFTGFENAGKLLFITLPEFDSSGSRISGGVGCAQCHRPPEFDIDPESLHNHTGFGIDSLVTKAPTIRDLVNPLGQFNGEFMHNNTLSNFLHILGHYDGLTTVVTQSNNNLDPRLRPNGHLQRLNITPQETNDLTDFLRTLTGQNVYTDPKWSDPFDANGDIEIITLGIDDFDRNKFKIYPNPVIDEMNIVTELDNLTFLIYNLNGQLIKTYSSNQKEKTCLDLSSLASNSYIMKIQNSNKKALKSIKFIKK